MLFLFVCFMLFCGCVAYLFWDVILLLFGKNIPATSTISNAPLIIGLSNATREIRGQNENFYIGVDENKRLIKLSVNKSRMFRTRDNYKHYSIRTKVFNYDDLISVKIIEDSVTVSKTNRGSQIIGAGIGGALLGGTGAIIGGLSGTKTGSTEIKDITLRIVINDDINSVFDLPFLERKYPIKKTSNQYTKAINSIYSWHSILTKIIENEDKIKNEQFKEDNINDSESDQFNKESNIEISTEINNNTNIVDQLEKIADMKSKGLISEVEFNKLKSKLIE
ncbi:SHOCT domain-containing protein [Mammaliicoccus sciuri]|uniref:SHOCT domain-containing protein n=1 Tax=Mammaliicoccus sciuri TaxID=1296 RepID=UPI001FB2009D|nr:SHOCT domain-containing protein [Mammaliicoccus sciuri]MCJ0919614.1 SHOCT domain-containing protein [Mammaliicoccus sciuri]MCJ0962608.1 SHOCT domain-containing protein [Mammaliicoccus sciuri]